MNECIDYMAAITQSSEVLAAEDLTFGSSRMSR